MSRSRCGVSVRDEIGRARVLPDDGVVPRTAGLRIPHDRRLALVGDADGGQIASGQSGRAQRAGDHFVHARGNLDRIVLDPAGARKNLPVLDLTTRHFLAGGIEHHEPRAGGALVERADEHGRHRSCYAVTCPACTASSSRRLMCVHNAAAPSPIGALRARI